MRQPTPAVQKLQLALFALAIAGASACRAPAELDPKSALPKIARIEPASDRPTIQVVVDASQPADILPDDVMARGGGAQDKAPMERFRRAIEGAMKSSGHFDPVPDDAEYRLELSVQEVKVETKDDLGFIDWFMWKFFGRYLVATARLGGVLYDEDDRQIGPDIEEFGQYRILSGKAFRNTEDAYLDIMGMGSSFAKTSPPTPAAANALQKASAKLIGAVAEAVDEENPYVKPIDKEVGE